MSTQILSPASVEDTTWKLDYHLRLFVHVLEGIIFWYMLNMHAHTYIYKFTYIHTDTHKKQFTHLIVLVAKSSSSIDLHYQPYRQHVPSFVQWSLILCLVL